MIESIVGLLLVILLGALQLCFLGLKFAMAVGLLAAACYVVVGVVIVVPFRLSKKFLKLIRQHTLALRLERLGDKFAVYVFALPLVATPLIAGGIAYSSDGLWLGLGVFVGAVVVVGITALRLRR